MIPAPKYAGSSVHLHYPDREAVIRALSRLDLALDRPIPVWPPRPLPAGFVLSPPREGWVSLWAPFPDQDDWMDSLTGLLECAGLSFHLVPEHYFITNFYRHGCCTAASGSPLSLAREGFLEAQAVEELMADGNQDYTGEDVMARMDEIAREPRWRQELAEYDRLWPDAARIKPFLPEGASEDRALELLEAGDVPTREIDDLTGHVEEALEAFALYLGVRDATWFPQDDWGALAEGDYDDEEGLPEGWRDFVVVASRRLPVV